MRNTVEFIKRAKIDVTNISRFGASPHASASKMVQNESETINLRSLEAVECGKIGAA